MIWRDKCHFDKIIGHSQCLTLCYKLGNVLV